MPLEFFYNEIRLSRSGQTDNRDRFVMEEYEEQFLRIAKVIEKTGKPRSSIYREIQAGTFPRPERIGPRAVAWRWSELRRWMAAPQGYQVD